jgi:hypothetical protein
MLDKESGQLVSIDQDDSLLLKPPRKHPSGRGEMGGREEDSFARALSKQSANETAYFRFTDSCSGSSAFCLYVDHIEP